MKAADRILAGRYAGAYMALEGAAFAGGAEEAAAGNKIGELEKLKNLSAQFRKLFLHPLVGYENKKDILARLLSGDVNAAPAAEFARLLLRENRFYLLDAILENCARLYDACAGIVRAEVVSRHPLSQEELERLGRDITAAFGKKARVSRTTSERVIGGLEVKINDLLIDGTVKGRLERLKKSILA